MQFTWVPVSECVYVFERERIGIQQTSKLAPSFYPWTTVMYKLKFLFQIIHLTWTRWTHASREKKGGYGIRKKTVERHFKIKAMLSAAPFSFPKTVLTIIIVVIQCRMWSFLHSTEWTGPSAPCPSRICSLDNTLPTLL